MRAIEIIKYYYLSLICLNKAAAKDTNKVCVAGLPIFSEDLREFAKIEGFEVVGDMELQFQNEDD